MIQYNYIAGQTPLDEDEKYDLIPNIITRTDLDRFEQKNILEARKWLMHKSSIKSALVFAAPYPENITPP